MAPSRREIARSCSGCRHPDRGGPRRGARRGLGGRRGPGHRAGAPRAAVPQIRRRRGPRGRARRRAGTGHLQGPGRGPWRTHPGRERGPGPRHSRHLHDSAGRAGRRRRPPAPPRPARCGDGRGAHPRGRRRPGHTAPCSRHAGGGGLRAPGHRRPPGSCRASSGPRSPGWCCST